MSQWMAGIAGDVFDKAGEVLPGNDCADRSSQYVIEKQSRDGKLGQRPAHCLFHYAVDAAAGEHAARFDIERSNGVAEQHDREDEPRGTLADDLLGVTSGVVRRGSQVGENDGGRAPERNEGQHHRGGDEDLYGWFGSFSGGGHA